MTILLNSLDSLAKHSGKLSIKILFAFYLLLAWLIAALLLWGLAVLDLNVFDILAYMFLIAIVIVVMIYMVDVRESLANVVAQYQAYQFIMDMSLKVPEGANKLERFLNYLNASHDFEKRVARRNGKIMRDITIENMHFDLYAEIPSALFGKLRGIKSYSFYLVIVDNANIELIKKIIGAAVENSKRKKLDLGRIVLIVTEVSDELYEFIKSQDLPVQLVLEMEDGTYDFIPFIGPRADLLP